MRRRSIRKQKGTGCGCGGMEMLGFPKTGGFLSLFGGQEEAVGTPPGSIGPSDSSVVMKEALPQDMRMKKSDAIMKEGSPEEIVSDYEVRNSSTPRRSSMTRGVSSVGEKPKRPERGERMRQSSSPLKDEIRKIKQIKI